MIFLNSSFLLLGLLVILLVFFQYLNRDKNIRTRIYRDDIYAASFAEGVDNFIFKGKYSPIYLKNKLPLTDGFKIDDFTVFFCKEINKNIFILQVHKDDVEIMTDKRGRNSPYPVDYYMYFKLILDPSKQEILIYSHLFSDNFDKDWRKNFSTELYKYLKSQTII